jgi:hypothetical protein
LTVLFSIFLEFILADGENERYDDTDESLNDPANSPSVNVFTEAIKG